MRIRVQKQNKPFIYPALLFLLFLASSMVFSLYSDKPSFSMIKACREALVEARQEHAEHYAPDLYEAAQQSWQKAFAEWQRQNARLSFTRDFTSTDSLMREVRDLAMEAVIESKHRRDSLDAHISTKLSVLANHQATLRSELNRLPVKSSSRKKFVQGELLVLEGREAFDRHDLLTALDKIEQGAILLDEVALAAKTKFDDYLNNSFMWQEWVRETIEWSRRHHDTAIIVDKVGARCLVYSSGVLEIEVPAEFGPEWMGHKQQKGDGTTPEGQYFIIRKKKNGNTIYYKALEINYPNERDKRAFQDAKKNGQLAPTAQIGGLIEIHGEGGKGVNWTKGCVALENRHMDEIYDLVDVGTPVTIVGSMQPPK